MARYDLFQAGFNNFEETINFGRRAGGDSESLYEICTLAVIRASEQIESSHNDLQITSYYEVDGRIFFGINNCLRVLKNTSRPDQLALLEFNTFLDNIAVSPCGKFILICTRNGEISIRELSSSIIENDGPIINGGGDDNNGETSFNEGNTLSYKCSLVFAEKIKCSYMDDVGKCFIGAYADASSELPTFYVVTCGGLVKKISFNSNETDGEHLFVSCVVSDLKRNIKICAFAYPYLCLEGQALLILDLRSNNCEIDDALGLKALHSIGQNFLAFDNEDNVFMIDSASCLIFGLNDELPYFVNAYDKMLVLVDGDRRLILATTKNEPKIKLFQFPESNVVYELPLTYPVHLLNMKGFTEEILFLAEVHKNNTLSEIRLQYVTETDPDLRVRRLVQKGLIEKAEIFAQTYNVDPEFLAQAKAEHIMEKLECTTEEINELLQILETITDHSFRMTCCDSVMCKTASDTRKVLRHGAFMEIDVRDCSVNEGDPLLFMKRKFNRLLHRFDTYLKVCPEYNQRSWRYFADCDLIEEVKTFLRQGRIEEATLIYSRLEHYEFFSLTNERLEEFTEMLNQTLARGTKFLNTFIPLTLKYKPDALIIFVEWVHKRVYQLEKETDLDFPDCAIKFLEDVTNLLNMYIPGKSHGVAESRDVLANLLRALNNIQMLVNHFFIKLPLSEYLSAPQDIVRTLLNVELDPTHLDSLMTEFLYPFMLKCGVDVDALLIEEIKSLFIYEEKYWLNSAHVLLKFVARVDKKLEVIKEILEVATKPWSEKVRDIARMTFEYSSTNPIAEEIVELLRDEHILIVLNKYNVNKKNFASLEDKLFYFRRILYLNRDDYDKAIEDIHQLCRDNEDRLHTDQLLIKELITAGVSEKAMALMDKLEPKDICTLGKELLEDILFTGEQDILSDKYRKAYQAAISPLWTRLSMHTKTKEEMEDICYIYSIANAVYGIYNEYGIKVNSSMLRKDEKENTLNVLFGKVTELVISSEEISSFEELIRHCKKLAHYFGDSLESILLKFVTIGDNFNLCLSVGKYFLEESQCSELLTLCAVYLFKCSKGNFGDAGDETFLDVAVAANRSSISDDDLEAVRLARELCIKALISCTEDEVAILEVLRWIDSCYYLSNMSEQLQFYAELNGIFLPISRPYYFGMSFETIKMMFNMFCAYVEPLRIDNLKYLTYFKANGLVTLGEIRQERDEFLWNIGALLKQDQHLTVFNMIRTVQQSCLYCPHLQEEILKPLQHYILNTFLPEFMSTVMSHKYIDKYLLLNLMLLFDSNQSQEQLQKYLTVYKKQPNKLSVITQVGLNLLACHGVEDGRDALLNILNLCKWWFRIDDPKIKYEAYFSIKPEPRLELLIKEEKVTLGNLPEYCTDFGLDLQYCYLKYLKIILLNWQPDVQYITELSGKKNIVIKNAEGELTSKCSKILECITDKSEVFKLTQQIWPLINFYYYEVYLVILFIHSGASSTSTIPTAYRPLLYFLKTYRRVSSPARLEIEQWHGSFPSKPLIDPLSEFRLPLTSTFLSDDIWNIIKPEVNLDTYKQWFKVATILKQYLSQLDICTYAINSPLESGLIKPLCNAWELSLKYDHLLSKVDECASNISNLERATAALFKLTFGMPPGADKVQMAKLSYKYAKLNREANTADDVEITYVKVKQRYLNHSAVHILHKYQLAEAKYLEQVAQPADLIWELCNDTRIETYFDNLLFHCPDINKAVEELCTLFGLNIKREYGNVLTKFLRSTSLLDLDCTRLQGNESINLKRACYLCESHDLRTWQKFLIDHGNKSENDMSYKANALRCFYNISDRDTVEVMFGMDHDEFVKHLEKVSVIAKMADLGLKFETVMQLDQQNQKRILKNLAKLNKPLAIKCIASLCKIYSLDDLKYWEYIVDSSIQHRMIRELRDYLEILKDRCMSDRIKEAWNVVLRDAFSKLSSSASLESEVVLLLQTCPVLYELDLKPFIQECNISERPDIADILRHCENH